MNRRNFIHTLLGLPFLSLLKPRTPVCTCPPDTPEGWHQITCPALTGVNFQKKNGQYRQAPNTDEWKIVNKTHMESGHKIHAFPTDGPRYVYRPLI